MEEQKKVSSFSGRSLFLLYVTVFLVICGGIQAEPVSRKSPVNVTFSGGGTKGIAYVGAIEAMEEANVLHRIKRYAGTSAGAITAALSAVGYHSTELRKHLGKDFVDLLDPEEEFSEGLLHWMEGKTTIRSLILNYFSGWGAIINPIGRAKELYCQLSSLDGLCNGYKLREWIEELILEKTAIPNCTFRELESLIAKNPDQFKELHIFAIRLKETDAAQIVRFSHENPEWRDLIISSAVRASASIPAVFKPHQLMFKNVSGELYIRSDCALFVDGGLLKNDPVDVFDEEKYQVDFQGDRINSETLGLSVYTAEKQAGNIFRKGKRLGAKSLIKALLFTYYYAEDSLDPGYNIERRIRIPITGVSLVNFDVDETKKEEMIAAGKKSTEIFLSSES